MLLHVKTELLLPIAEPVKARVRLEEQGSIR